MSSKVLPPANGKKLWRVKKTQPSRHSSISSSSTTSHQSNASLNSIQTSMECLNNSLRIAAAASKFTIKRPPLRRPKINLVNQRILFLLIYLLFNPKIPLMIMKKRNQNK